MRDGFWMALFLAVFLSVIVAGFADLAYRPDGYPCEKCMKHEEHKHFDSGYGSGIRW